MTQHVSNPSDIQVAEFVWSLPEEEQEKYNLETAEGLSAAIDAYHASMAGEDSDTGPKERKAREAKEYSVLLLVNDGSSENECRMILIGSGLGSVGREPIDPVKWSDARKLRSRADIKAHKARKMGDKELNIEKGSEVHVMVLPTEEYLGTFFA